MKNAKSIKKTFSSCLNDICENFSVYCNNPSADFTRNRKLSFWETIRAVFSLTNKSLSNELLDYFDFADNMPTVSAFVQQRSKIKATAFYDLFKAFTKEEIPNQLFNGYRLIAFDGSDFKTPTDKTDLDSFYENTNGKSPYNLYHLNAFYDLLSQAYVDALIQKSHLFNERAAFVDMLKTNTFPLNTIFISDRGLECFNTIAHVTERNMKYLFRIKDIHSSGIAADFSFDEDEFDKTIDLSLTRKRTKDVQELLQDKWHYKFLPQRVNFDFLPESPKKSDSTIFYNLKFRIVRFKLSDNSYEVLITNLDEKEFPPKKLKELYFMRWGIETSFRDLKHTLGTIYFHSKKAELISQEIFAKLTIYNFTQFITSTLIIGQKKRKHTYKVNFSNAVNICRRFFFGKITPLCCETRLQKCWSVCKSNRSFERINHPRQPVSFYYRIA